MAPRLLVPLPPAGPVPAAQRKADQIDLREPERADECDRVLGHRLDAVRRLAL
jgi:hypothetical protein